ncbi:MAG: choice-of-anchor D domain-containing protein [Candidatus Sulfotelmatobacter sp.]
MKHIGPRYDALVILLALGTLLGCQGVSVGNKPASQAPVSGQLAAAPDSVSFGNVQVGTSQTLSDTLTNNGGSSLTVTQAAVTGTGFSIYGLNLPLTLVAGQSATFSVVFQPQSAGSASGNLGLTNNGSSGLLNVALSATGVTAGNLTASPTSLSFGSVQVGSTQSLNDTLKNSGNENLTIASATATGAGFRYTGLSLPMTLAPNQSTTFAVSFAPQSGGSSNGTLSLSVDGSSTSVDVALSGTGMTPGALTPSPTSLTFGSVGDGKSQTQTQTVRNTGGASVVISQVTATGAGFSVSGVSTPLTLTQGQSTSFSVTFAPQSSGNYSGTVAMASNASNPNLTVSLSGSGTEQAGQLSISPTTINTGNVTVGTSGTKTGTLTATGASVAVSSVSMGGTNPAEFSISGVSFPLTVTTSQPVTFTVTFTPQASGGASANASFTSNASNSPANATLTGTGVAATAHTVNLSWDASNSPNIVSYNVYRAPYIAACGVYSKIGSSANTTYMDSSVVNGQAYCYETTAINSSNEESADSVPIQDVAIPLT